MKNIKNVDIATIRRFPAMDFIGNDFAIFDNIGDIPLFGYPTRLNASCLTLCMKGHCKIRINLKEHELTEGVLVVTLPEQILQQVERSDDFTGVFIVVSGQFIDDVLPTVQQLFPLFFPMHLLPPLFHYHYQLSLSPSPFHHQRSHFHLLPYFLFFQP